jgi:hypothetical protein
MERKKRSPCLSHTGLVPPETPPFFSIPRRGLEGRPAVLCPQGRDQSPLPVSHPLDWLRLPRFIRKHRTLKEQSRYGWKDSRVVLGRKTAGRVGTGAGTQEKHNMAWEQRGHQRFYYRSRKVQGRVVREYLGRGPRAVRAAAEDTAKRAGRNKEHMERKMWEALDTHVAHLDTLMTLLSHSTLVDNGLYQHHRGEWRKRRPDGRHNSTLSPQS